MKGQELDSFVIASGRRKVVLYKHAGVRKYPYEVVVYHKRAQHGRPVIDGKIPDFVWVRLSSSEYIHEATARQDFETRRPNMRDASKEVFEMPMQKGKRLVQEAFAEKLRG